MKKITLLLTITLLFFACKKDKKSKIYHNKIEITETINKNESENNYTDLSENDSEKIKIIKTQLDDYLTAFLNGNSDIALTYCYPDLFEFMENQYPELNSIEEAKSIFKESIDALKEMAVNGVKYEFEVGEIKKVVDENNLEIFLIVTYLKVEKGLDSNTSGGEQFAISNDNGKTWKFLEKDANRNYLKVLKLNIPNRIVNQLE